MYYIYYFTFWGKNYLLRAFLMLGLHPKYGIEKMHNVILIKLIVFISLCLSWGLWKILGYWKSILKCQKKKRKTFKWLSWRKYINTCEGISVLFPFHCVSCLTAETFYVSFSWAYSQISLPFIILFAYCPPEKN